MCGIFQDQGPSVIVLTEPDVSDIGSYKLHALADDDATMFDTTGMNVVNSFEHFCQHSHQNDFQASCIILLSQRI